MKNLHELVSYKLYDLNRSLMGTILIPKPEPGRYDFKMVRSKSYDELRAKYDDVKNYLSAVDVVITTIRFSPAGRDALCTDATPEELEKYPQIIFIPSVSYLKNH